MAYRVVVDFTDKTDGRIYRAGDEFPRPGVKVSAERVAELTSTDNMRGRVLIEAEKRPQKAKIQPVGEEKGETDKLVADKPKKPRKRKKEN